MITGYYKHIDKAFAGEIICMINENKSSYSLILVDRISKNGVTFIDDFFKSSNRIKIHKTKSNHKTESGEDWFLIFPYDFGYPVLFGLLPNQDELEEKYQLAKQKPFSTGRRLTSEETIEKIERMISEQKVSAAAACKHYGITLSTFYKRRKKIHLQKGGCKP